jgi:hypothetical protein
MAAWFTTALAFPRHDASVLGGRQRDRNLTFLKDAQACFF